jgi:sec-independent protein translocase protein TatC
VTEEASHHSPEDDVEMGFLEHLDELRTRVIRALWGLVPCIAGAWMFKERLLELLVAPMVEGWKRLGLGEPKLHFAHAVDPVMAYLKLSLVTGCVVASPWLFYQLWSFISPGLYRQEKKLVIPFVGASTLFFVGGAVFGYWVVFPLGFETFLSFAGTLPNQSLRIEPTLMIMDYLDFTTQLLLAFGVVFEIPVVITFLALAGIVNWKQLLKFSRWWVLLSTVIAAILTPPDVGSQMMMLVPMVVLYFASIGLAYLFGKKPPTEADTALR